MHTQGPQPPNWPATCISDCTNFTEVHHTDGYYALRKHIVDFLVTRAKAH